MTLPVAERILQSVETRLTVIAIVGLTVDRNRQEDVQTWPMLVPHDGSEGPVDYSVSGVEQHFRTITVEGFGRADDKASMQVALATLQAETEKALTNDVSLGGLVVNVSPGEVVTSMAPQEDTAWQGSFSAEYEILYWTKAGDPYSVGP